MKKIFILLTLVLCLFSLTACKNKVTSIKIVESTVPEIIDVAQLDSELTKIQIELIMKKGDSSFVNLSKDMISSEDYTKLTNLGTNTVVVSYEEFTTSLTLTVEDAIEIKKACDKENSMCYFLENVYAKQVYPMHDWGKSAVIETFLKDHPEREAILNGEKRFDRRSTEIEKYGLRPFLCFHAGFRI